MMNARTSLTVKQLSTAAGVSPRTLHYYDEIGLLKPETIGENGYRYYGEAALLRLQQILFFRELGFSLEEIQEILDQPGFDLLRALKTHRKTLRGRVERLELLIQTVEKTIDHIEKDTPMSKNDYFKGFNEEKQKEYQEEIRQKYGEEPLTTSLKRWNAMTPEEKQAFGAQGEELHRAIAAAMDAGQKPGEPAVQALIGQYREHMNFFYDVTLEIFEGLGHGYNSDPRFQAFYEAIHPGMAAYLEQAIEVYVRKQKS